MGPECLVWEINFFGGGLDKLGLVNNYLRKKENLIKYRLQMPKSISLITPQKILHLLGQMGNQMKAGNSGGNTTCAVTRNMVM